MKQQFSSLAL